MLFSTLMFSACSESSEINPIRKDVNELVFAAGTVIWEEDYSLIAQSEGILDSFQLEEGNFVQSGQYVGKLINSITSQNKQTATDLLRLTHAQFGINAPQRQQLTESLRIAQSSEANDLRNLQRIQVLVKSSTSSVHELEQAELRVELSKGKVKELQEQLRAFDIQSKQSIETASNTYQNATITDKYNQLYIPQKGRVTQVLKSAGDWIKKGEILAKIANDKNVELELYVDESSVRLIKIGQHVTIRLNTNTSTRYSARITRIYPEFNEQKQSFVCRAVFEKDEPIVLKGTQLEANILVNHKKNALLIPRSYLGYGNRVQEKGKDQSTVIKAGIISTELVEVLDGLSEKSILVPIER